MGASREISRGADEQHVDFTKLPYLQGVTKPTDPMDFTNDIWYSKVDYAMSNGWLLSTIYQYIDGFIVSSALPPVFPLFINSKAVGLDPAFNHDQLMYLMKSKADAWSTILSIPLDSDSAIELAYSWQDIDTPTVGKYKNEQIVINLVHRF